MRIKKILLITLITVALLFTLAVLYEEFYESEEAKYSDIKEAAQKYLEDEGNFGIAIGIFDKDKKKILCFGSKDADNRSLIDKNTLFEIGSITKVFTAILIEEMVQNKVIKLADPIGKLLPVKRESFSFDNSEISVLQLVTHSSGLPRMPTNWMATVTNQLLPYENYKIEDLKSFLESYELEKTPGISYQYSNLNYSILGLIISEKAGTTYEKLVKQNIIDKLGMENSYITGKPDSQENLAQGYYNKAPIPYWDLGIFNAAGGIKSNIGDMLIFLEANINTQANKLGEVLESTQKMRFSEEKSGVTTGLGWHISPFGNKDLICHNGGTGGFRSFMGFIKTGKTGVVVLSNSSNGVDQVGIDILEILSR